MGCDLWSDPEGKDNNPTRNRIESFSGKFVARFSDFVIVKSQEMANLIPFTKELRVIPNGVDFNHFMPMDKESAISKFNLPKNKKIILFACDHIDKRKNYALAKKAFNILDSQNPGEYFFWNAWGINHSLMPFVLNAADVLVFTSFFEGSPNLVKEAMACNLPIVSVPVGDVPEIIRSTKNCYVVDYDPTSIAEKLEEAISFGSRSNGREKIEHLRLEQIAYKIESVYRKVLG
jgi:glycosyltransferase involved in cell wall biosynthesis